MLKESENSWHFQDFEGNLICWIWKKHYILINLISTVTAKACWLIFQISWRFVHKCTRTSYKRALACFIAIARIHNSCARIYAQIIMKFDVYAQKIVTDHYIKFHDDLSFRCKTILVFFNHWFQRIFNIYAIMHLRSLQRWIITEWLWIYFETRSQNGPISVKWKHQSQLIFCILRLSHKHTDFNSSRGTP